ncbi:MAG: ABC transporter ATP-binding protein, partial [Opitutales bacterium]
LAQMEGLCDRVAILNKGRLLCEGAVEELLIEAGSDSFVTEGLDASGRAAVEAAIRASGGRLRGVEPARRGLEELFSRAINDEGEEAE